MFSFALDDSMVLVFQARSFEDNRDAENVTGPNSPNIEEGAPTIRELLQQLSNQERALAACHHVTAQLNVSTWSHSKFNHIIFRFWETNGGMNLHECCVSETKERRSNSLCINGIIIDGLSAIRFPGGENNPST